MCEQKLAIDSICFLIKYKKEKYMISDFFY